MAVVTEASRRGAADLDRALVERWLHHRNDTSALQALTRKGYVVDTMEIAAPWARLAGIFDADRGALIAVPHARAATCHLSHSYRDGACLYFTFAATPPRRRDRVDVRRACGTPASVPCWPAAATSPTTTASA